jgi:hypothetical protein
MFFLCGMSETHSMKRWFTTKDGLLEFMNSSRMIKLTMLVPFESITFKEGGDTIVHVSPQ